MKPYAFCPNCRSKTIWRVYHGYSDKFIDFSRFFDDEWVSYYKMIGKVEAIVKWAEGCIMSDGRDYNRYGIEPKDWTYKFSACVRCKYRFIEHNGEPTIKNGLLD